MTSRLSLYTFDLSEYRIRYSDVFSAVIPINNADQKPVKGPFFLLGDNNQNWQFRFFINPSKNCRNRKLYSGNWSSVEFYLTVHKKQYDSLLLRYWTYFFGTDGERHYINPSLEVFYGEKETSSRGCFILKNTLEKEKDLLLHNGNLIVQCEIQVLEKPRLPRKFVEEERRIVDVIAKLAQSDKTLAEYGSLLETGALSDVVIVACGKEFNAHKLILSFRSPVFEAMFDHEMVEKKHARVMIEDMEPEVCGEMLRYMYTGKLENLAQWAMELFVAADKYQIDSLKTKCERHILDSITSQNVCEALLLADLHQSNQLKQECTEYIRYNSTQVQSTEGWNKLTISRPDLALELGLNLN